MARRDVIRHRRGDTLRVTWPLTDPGTGLPYPNLTGWHVRAQARPYADSPTVLFTWADTGTPTAPASLPGSSVQLDATAAQTAAWTWRAADYDIELTDPTGRVGTPITGRLVVDPDTTR